MKYSIILPVLLLSSCALTSKQQPMDVAPVAIDPVTATETVTERSRFDLFADAHRCQGIVEYEAEIQNDEIRSRLTCSWEVTPDNWGSW